MALVRGEWPTGNSTYILDLIRKLGFPNLTTGPFVAGGAVRRMFDKGNTPVKNFDIDIFPSLASPGKGRSAIEIEMVLERRHDCERVERHGGRNPTHTSFYLTTGKVDVIHNRVFESAEALIADFDYTVCMAATDGWSWLADERFFRDGAAGKLVMNNPEQRRNHAHRLAKYCLHGFTPEPGVLSTVLGFDKPEFLARLTGADGTARMGEDY